MYESLGDIGGEIRKNRKLLVKYFKFRYGPVLKAMRKNYSLRTVDPSLRWFYVGWIPELAKEDLKGAFLKVRKFAGKGKKKLRNLAKRSKH